MYIQYVIKLLYRNCCHCLGKVDNLWWPSIQKSISVTKATESTLKLANLHITTKDVTWAQITQSFLLLDTEYFPFLRLEIACVQQPRRLKNFSPVRISFWTRGNRKHLSLLPAVSTLDTALLIQSWETAHGCLKCTRPKDWVVNDLNKACAACDMLVLGPMSYLAVMPSCQ